MFFCLPIFFGCQTKLKPDGEQQTPRVCPNCHNASVIYAKSTTWFELFFIPVIPFSKKHIWLCGICQWKTSAHPGHGEPIAGPGHHQHLQGYAPAYLNQPPK